MYLIHAPRACGPEKRFRYFSGQPSVRIQHACLTLKASSRVGNRQYQGNFPVSNTFIQKVNAGCHSFKLGYELQCSGTAFAMISLGPEIRTHLKKED
jgi:hypothetical protein